MTKELSLFDTLVSSTTSQTSSDTKTSKEGSSLFDELLKSATKESNQSGSTSNESTLTTKNQSQTLNNTEKVASQTIPDEKLKNIDVKNTQQTVMSSSISEVTNENKTNITNQTEKLVVSQDNIQTDEKVQVSNKNQIDNASKVEAKIETDVKNIDKPLLEENVKEIKNNDTKNSANTQASQAVDVVESDNSEEVVRQPSLFDSLMKSAKKQSLVNDILKDVSVDGTKEDKNLGANTSTNINAPLNQKVIDVSTNVISTDTNSVEIDVEELPQTDTKNKVSTPTTTTTSNKVQTAVNDVVTITPNQSGNETIPANISQESQNSTQKQSRDINQIKPDIVVDGSNVTIVNPIQNQETQSGSLKTPTEINIKNSVDMVSITPTQTDKEVVGSVKKDTNVVVNLVDNPTDVTQTSNILEESNKLSKDVISKDLKDIITNQPVDSKDTSTQKQEVIVKDSVVSLENIKENTKVPNQENKLVAKSELNEVQKVETKLENSNQEELNKIGNSNNKETVAPKTVEVAQNKQNAGAELAKLDTQSDKTLNIAKEDLQSLSQKQQNPLPEKKEGSSLLDKLIEDSLKVAKDEIKSPSSVLQNSISKSEEIDKSAVDKNSFMENIYKSTISKNANIAAMQNVATAKEIVKSGTSANDIKTSAQMLDLNLQDIEDVTQSQNDEIIKNKTKDNTSFINRVILAKNTIMQESTSKNELLASDDIKSNATTATQNNTQNNTLKVVEIEVREAEVLTIQNRIIGARQQLSSMMSDVARAMYENYKPPHTAFRINLNPANLGQIAILIRSQRADNSLSISMNMTNTATLESVVANQNELRNALMKSFDGAHTFEFDFRLDKDGSNGAQYEQNQDNDNQSNTNDEATNNVVEETNETEQPKNGTYF